jgi:hypothetical protein
MRTLAAGTYRLRLHRPLVSTRCYWAVSELPVVASYRRPAFSSITNGLADRVLETRAGATHDRFPVDGDALESMRNAVPTARDSAVTERSQDGHLSCRLVRVDFPAT